ncbi:MAG: zinc ribbon domain-containing protein [Mycobacterium sp.]
MTDTSVDGDAAPRRACPACLTEVPDAQFGGHCGAALDAPIGYWRQLLRPSVFAPAPRERLLLPTPTSALFPGLGDLTRKPFRLAMIVLAAGLVALSLLRYLDGLVILAPLGLPLLFGLYLWQSGAFRDIPVHILATAIILGAVLSVAWWIWTGGLVASWYGVPTVAGLALEKTLSIGLAITAGGAVLMLAPAAVVRLLHLPARESLDGFALGALAALTYMVAGTLTWLAPQFTSGLLDNLSATRLLEESVLYGVVDPVITVTLGGLFGVCLWFRPARRAGFGPRRPRVALATATAAAAIAYLAVWTIDAAQFPRVTELAATLTLAVVAVLCLRIGLQIALLHELPDAATEQPSLCVHCLRVVPEMPFCPACGGAARTSSRQARRRARESPPVRVETG